MELLGGIKNFAFRLATKHFQSEQQVRSLVNFDKIKTVGLLFDISQAETEAAMLETAAHLRNKGKNVVLLAFSRDKKELPREGIALFTPKDTNWYGIPKSETVTQFCETQFDVLLCPFTAHTRPLHYVVMASKARCRVGIYHLHESNDYELMVQLGDKLPVLNIVAQMLRLLLQINTTNEIF